MNIVAFGASTSSTSINQSLATYVANLIPNATVRVLDLNDYALPLFSEDKEKQLGQPQLAHDFLNHIASADALVISYAEHNGHYPAAYKSLFDWASRIERSVFANKPALYLSASPGPGGAQSVLAAAVASASFFGAEVKGSLSVANFYDKFDMSRGVVIDDELIIQLAALVEQLTA